MRQAQSAHFEEFSHPISAERSLQWVQQSDPTVIAQRLRLSSAEAPEFVTLAEAFRGARTALDAPFPHQCEAYYRACDVVGKDPAATKKALAAEFSSHIKGLPGDAIFLTSLSVEHDEGYVVYLRILRELTDGQVGLKTSSRSFEITHERIARLRPPYLYRLTQQLGAVFSSIGLPGEYEASRDAIAQGILEA